MSQAAVKSLGDAVDESKIDSYSTLS